MGLDGFRVLREIWEEWGTWARGVWPEERWWRQGQCDHELGLRSSLLHFTCPGSGGSPPGDAANGRFLCSRRCGYSKAKQDPEEEKMHFHNGHSKRIVKTQKNATLGWHFCYFGFFSGEISNNWPKIFFKTYIVLKMCFFTFLESM